MYIKNSNLHQNLIAFSEIIKRLDNMDIHGDSIAMPINEFYKILQTVSYLGYKEGIAEVSEQMKCLSETMPSEGSEDLYGENGTELPA